MEKKDNWTKIEIVGKIIGAILIPVIILFVGNVYNNQQKMANDYHRDFQNSIELIKLCNNDNKGLKLAGFDYAIYLQKQGYLDTNLVSILSQSQADESDAETAKQTAAKLEKLKLGSTEVNNIIEKLDEDLAARVFFHINSEKQRNKARQIETYLEDDRGKFNKGIIVPGIELRDYDLSFSELRYFKASEKAEALNIKSVFDSIGVQIIVKDLSSRYKNAKLRPRHYEVWFGDNFN